MRRCGALRVVGLRRFRKFSSNALTTQEAEIKEDFGLVVIVFKTHNYEGSQRTCSFFTSHFSVRSWAKFIFPFNSICSDELPTKTSYVPFSARHCLPLTS